MYFEILKKQNILIFVLLTLFNLDTFTQKPNKIVGLVQARNEEFFIEQCLKALACYTDAIVIIDDQSTDNTTSIIKSLEKELNVEKIIIHNESSWQKRDEKYNRQLLLDTGRSIKGTHFIFMDADNMFSSKCLENNWLKNKILSMKKGQLIRFWEVNFWGGIENYRIDSAYDLSKKWGKTTLRFV